MIVFIVKESIFLYMLMHTQVIKALMTTIIILNQSILLMVSVLIQVLVFIIYLK